MNEKENGKVEAAEQTARSLIDWDKAQYWTNAANTYLGCAVDKWTSPACANCYAREISERFKMTEKFKLTRKPNTKMPKTGIVFCGNMTDLFLDEIPDKDLNEMFFSLMKVDKVGLPCRDEKGRPAYHPATYLWLSKRAERMANYILSSPTALSAPNCWYGMTGENQEWYDRRVQHFRRIRDKRILDIYLQPQHLWLSAEPLLGPLDLGDNPPFGWVVVGCESGANARECKTEWIRSVVEQCKKWKIPVFVKQIQGANRSCIRDINLFPEDLRIRQMPFPHDFKKRGKCAKKAENN